MSALPQRQCSRCHNLYPVNLFGAANSLCVYCVADEAEQIPEADAPEVEDVQEESGSVQEKARAELALRFLTRKRLLPFVERFNPDYSAGWVHKDVCKRLEDFSKAVVEKKSPRLMLFLPPRHGK